MESYLNILKVFASSTVSFFIGMAFTPFLTDFLYKHKLWKKKAGKISPDGKDTPIFNSLHKEKDVGTPRMGGIVIWGSVIATTVIFWLLQFLFPSAASSKLDFLSRNQTWLPLLTLLVGSCVGLIDDILQVTAPAEKTTKAGLSFYKRLIVVIILGLVGAYWFYFKLGMHSVSLPFVGEWHIGIWLIPLFVLVMIALFSSGVIDGLDGLSGGIMATIFAAYTGIAYFQNQIDLAAFCAAVTGGILAFLWFNIPPARFYMTETGILGLTTALTVVAFLTDSVLVLPILAFPLLITSLSVIIQLFSKKFFKRKVFLVAPLHHHFEAIGWPAYKVVMRYWVIGIICAIVGMILTLISKI